MKQSSLNKDFGNVNISTKPIPKRGTCLVATDKTSGMSIYMDYMGFAIPDGQNAYLFGNKLIMVTRWSDLSKEDIEIAMRGNITLGVMPLKKAVHFAVKFGDYPWGDVFTSYGITAQMNDFSRPVDEIIFIFCDKSDGLIYAAESVATGIDFGCFISECNKLTYKQFAMLFPEVHKLFSSTDFTKANDLAMLEELADGSQDWCDVLYDQSFAYSNDESRLVRSNDPETFMDDCSGIIKLVIEGYSLKRIDIND